MQLILTNLPSQAKLGTGGAVQWAQITKLSLTVPGQVNGNNFTFNPSGCQTAYSSVTVDTTTDPSPSTLTITSAFNPTPPASPSSRDRSGPASPGATAPGLAP